MGKNFTKTMTLEAFKESRKETPQGILDNFLSAAIAIEKKMENYGHALKKLVDEFLKRPDRLLFTYEHLPASDELKPSEMAEKMRNSEHWTISKVTGKQEIIISFFNEGKSMSTFPVSISEFKEFLGI